MMDEIDDVFLDIAIRTTNSNEITKYFNAIHEMRVKRHNIERTCLENFIELFDENLCSGNREMNTLEGNAHERLKDDNAIAMTSTVDKVRSNCHQALLNLDERLCQTLSSDIPGISENPVLPEIVCQAFYKACDRRPRPDWGNQLWTSCWSTILILKALRMISPEVNAVIIFDHA